MLPAHVAASRSMLAAVQRDFAQLRTLDHPSIARLIELGCNGQQYYVTGERLDGEPLREVLNHLLPERLEVEEADEIVRAIGSALVYAHERGIAHGDVRAENVLVTMDRRFVLTNFLARRVAKMASRPPRPSDDLKGLARLAAELYTGSISPRGLRDAAHDVPAARLNAIRTVLETPARRPDSVAEFLEAAGLDDVPDVPHLAAAPRQVATRMPKPQRSWSLWRFVVPMTAVALLGSLGAAYHGGFGVAAEELKVRGLDALRAVAARVAPLEDEAAAARTESVEVLDPEALAPDPPDVAAETEELEPEIAPSVEDEPVARSAAPPPVVEPAVEPAAQVPPPAEPAARAATVAATAAPTPTPMHDARVHKEPERASGADEQPVVSFGVPRIAAREDHSVVAIDVVRSGDTSQEATVGWWTSPDTAHEEEDYAKLGRRSVTIPVGTNVARVLIPIVNDGVRESAEVFTVHMGQPRGGVAGPVTSTRVTLHDDD